jgi:hypothetical protein
MNKYAPPVEVYVNPKQEAFLQSPAKEKIFIGGRGSGKSTCNGYQVYLYFLHLPRAKGFILGLTYNQILTKFLPPMMDVWANLNLHEYSRENPWGHYVVGVKPPAHWAKPYQPPRKYEQVITFFNGFTIEFLSFDRKNHTRGGNYDFGIFDEAVLLNKERHDTEILPMIRGNIHRFPNNTYHHQRVYTSSQSWLPSGEWVSDMGLAADSSNPYGTFYIESTAYDNVDVLGKDYLKMLERRLPYWTFQVEVMNQKISRRPGGFYEEFEENRHLYYDSFEYDNNNWGALTTVKDKDYSPLLPLELSFDFGGKICSVTIHQEHRSAEAWEERVINCFYRKHDLSQAESKSLILQLVEDIATYYKGHLGRILIRGDRNGNNRNANSSITYYEEIVGVLRRIGFKDVEVLVKGLDPAHQLKQYGINVLLREQDTKLPIIRINQNKCKDLVISMQAADMSDDFKKDKSSERKDIPQEHATHLSDCFDNYFYPKYKHLFGSSGGYSPEVIFVG